MLMYIPESWSPAVVDWRTRPDEGAVEDRTDTTTLLLSADHIQVKFIL